jgi:hypothetical protein
MKPLFLGRLSLGLLLLGCGEKPPSAPSSDAAGDPEPDAGLHEDARPAPADAAVDGRSPADAAADRRQTGDLHPEAPPPAADAGPSPFAAVQKIFDESCVTCHDAHLPPRPEGLSYPLVPLTAGDAHRSLVGKRSFEDCGGVLVVPGDPTRSFLIQKLTQDPPCDGKRMPSPGMLASRPPLPAAQVAIIRAWITAGAPM